MSIGRTITLIVIAGTIIALVLAEGIVFIGGERGTLMLGFLAGLLGGLTAFVIWFYSEIYGR